MQSIRYKLIEQLQFLPETALEQVLEFVEGLNQKHLQKPVGVSGHQLLQFAGAIPSNDLQLMAEAIELNCNQVDLNEW